MSLDPFFSCGSLSIKLPVEAKHICWWLGAEHDFAAGNPNVVDNNLVSVCSSVFF